ncbi:hypothetical protein PMW_158 [Pseudomonas phage phiPMW]|uniref:Uncharacterized protein n=1 Tax=Pseudomonas phage phiPMW TaxID=1815582 RepID=A0A1S5R1J8_9CAUD|nr:hypothetical protein FDG97_gp192 [Pseudomonas phage phiPMW]ANA49283.1 hypothetical protein PMW_158 [Pseudomonas phage phiPMW]
MGSWILWMHVVFDGQSMILQDRYYTFKACENAAVQVARDIGGDWGVRTRSHTCTYTGDQE